MTLLVKKCKWTIYGVLKGHISQMHLSNFDQTLMNSKAYDSNESAKPVKEN